MNPSLAYISPSHVEGSKCFKINLLVCGSLNSLSSQGVALMQGHISQPGQDPLTSGNQKILEKELMGSSRVYLPCGPAGCYNLAGF